MSPVPSKLLPPDAIPSEIYDLTQFELRRCIRKHGLDVFAQAYRGPDVDPDSWYHLPDRFECHWPQGRLVTLPVRR